MQFRISTCLILGLTVAVISGCSCRERCRFPRLHRYYGGTAAKISAQEDVMFDQTSSCRACNAIAAPNVEPLELPAPQLIKTSNSPTQDEEHVDGVYIPELEPASSSLDNVGHSLPVKSGPAQTLTGSPGEDEQSNRQDHSILDQATKKIKAIPISTSTNQSQPAVPKHTNPETGDVGNEDAIEYHGEDLPASSNDANPGAPIVLKAVPSTNHRVNDPRVADRSGAVDSGFPTTNTDAAPHKQLPLIEPGTDGFTKPNHCQFHVENTESMLLNALATIGNGFSDQPSTIQETPGGLNTTDSRIRIVDGKPVAEQVRILRLKATTPIDREQRFPPIVSIKSIMEPIIVRKVHPDASQPVVNLQSTDPKIQDRPVFDEDRLETLIRGLSSRAEVEQTGPKTIDR